MTDIPYQKSAFLEAEKQTLGSYSVRFTAYNPRTNTSPRKEGIEPESKGKSPKVSTRGEGTRRRETGGSE